MKLIIYRVACLLLAAIIVLSTVNSAQSAQASAASMKAASTLLPVVYQVKYIGPEGDAYFYNALDSHDPMIASGSLVYFIADDGDHGRELWVSDGSSNGTHMVKELFDGSAGFPNYYDSNFYGIPFGDHSLLFKLDGLYADFGVYRTDGTAAGTVKLNDSTGWLFRFGDQFLSIDPSTLILKSIDLVTGAITPLATLGGTCLNGFWFFDSEIYIFTKDSSGMGCMDILATGYLWKSDGTAAGTVLVKAIGMAMGCSMVSLNSKIYIISNNLDTGSLWMSDGTTGGTALLKSFPGQRAWIIGPANGLLFINLLGTSREMWQSDGTANGTIRDLNAPNFFTASYFTFNDTIYFYGRDEHDACAWYKTRGVAAGGVVKVLDIAPDESPDPDDPNSYVNTRTFQANGLLYLYGDSGSGHNVLWVTDGVSKTALLGSQAYVSPDNEAMVGSRLFFSARDDVAGNELWTSDGTPLGTIRLADIRPNDPNPNDPNWGISSAPKNLTAASSMLFFTANDGDDGRQLWVADAAVTARVFLPLVLK